MPKEIRIEGFMDLYLRMLDDITRESRDVDAELERMDRIYDLAVDEISPPADTDTPTERSPSPLRSAG